ncbi:MAG: Crp/Fnr family transcriptional regulator [Azospirillum sp.]|nr:Crp/Fnr family transcriptional regulator [Azospirillum sp.]
MTVKPSALLLTENDALMGGPPGLFEGLTRDERRTVLAHGAKRVIYKNEPLFKQGARHDGIFFIETGRIRVFYTAPSGREITLAYWSPGHFVGGPNIFEGGEHQWSGTAANNSSVVWLPGKALRRLIAEIPQLAIGLLDGLAFKGRCYSALAQMLGTRSVSERLAHLLLHLARAYGQATPDGIRIEAFFTHADLAHMVGATRQWVTISLKRLHERGVLQCSKSGIVVRQPDKLMGLV